MQTTEDKLARELGLTIHSNKNGEVFAAPNDALALTRTFRKCLELTDETTKYKAAADRLIGSEEYQNDRAEKAEAKARELTEQRERGVTSAENAEEFDKKVFGYHGEPCDRYQFAEAYASSRLAEVTAQVETLEEQKSNLLGVVRNAHHDIATLRAELAAAREQLITAHDEISDQLATVARLTGERDALRILIMRRTGASSWEEFTTGIDFTENDPLSYIMSLRTALSQAQQALRDLETLFRQNVGHHKLCDIVDDLTSTCTAIASGYYSSLPCVEDCPMCKAQPLLERIRELLAEAALPSDTPGAQAQFEVGQRVWVNHPRYQGFGKFQYEKPRVIGVLLGNGNTWEYEYETVKLAD